MPNRLSGKRELGVGAAVELVAGDEVLPGRGDGRDGVEDGRLPGRGGHRARRSVDGGQPLLEHVGGGVHEPRVDVAERSQGEEVGRVLGVAEHVAGGLIDGHRPGQGVLVGGVPGVEGQGVYTKRMCIVYGHFMPFSHHLVPSSAAIP